MDCKNVIDNLSAYLDKALPGEEMELVQTHLDNCPSCRKEYNALEKTVLMLSSLEEIVPPASFRRDLRRKLEKSVEKKRFFSTGLIPEWIKNIRRSQLMPVAAALILMVLILPFLGDSLRMGSLPKDESGYTRESVAYDRAPQFNSLNTTDQMGGAPENKQELLKTTGKMAAPMAPAPAPAQAPAPSGGIRTSLTMQDTMGEQSAGVAMERKIIKNADVHLQVDHYESAVEAIKSKVAALAGYVSNESVNAVGPAGILNGHLQVRIPQMHFDSFLSGMEGLGKIRSRNINTQDVTEEYMDVESRLKAMRVKEERLLALLTKSGQLSDVLAVENELANTRAQLESLQGRMRYLNNRTEFSTIGINIQVAASTQQISTGGLQGVLLRAKEAFIQTINNILLNIGKLIVYLGAALPYLILTAVLVAGVWIWTKRKKL